MNANNAWGFLATGTLFGLMPEIAPDLCQGGASAGLRETWLGLMSALQLALAAGYFLRRALGALAAALEYDRPGAEPGGAEKRTARG